MTTEQFIAWIQSLVREGRLTEAQAADLIDQRILFDEARDGIHDRYPGSVAGYVNGVPLVADSVGQLLDMARNQFPADGNEVPEEVDRPMVYFEPIGTTAFGMEGGVLG